MASTELLGALSKRRELAEAQGAVFEGSPRASGADTAWDQRHDSQFTPRGRHRVPAVGRLPLPEDDESTGTITPREEVVPAGKVRCTQSPILAAEAPEAPAEAVEEAEKKEVIARERALAVAGVVQAVVQAENEKADESEGLARERAEAAAGVVQALQAEKAPSEAPSPCVEAPAGSAAPLAPPVEIDVTVACAAEEASGEEAPPTQPATPKGRESLEFSWAPARLPDLGPVRAGPEDLNSSRTYGGPPLEKPSLELDESVLAMQHELERSLQSLQQQQYSEHMQQQQPFPKAHSIVRQSRLEEVAHEVAKLIPEVQAVNAAAVPAHPTELEALLNRAKEVLESSRLSEQDLEALGWPTEELKAIRELMNALQKWQFCEQTAKEALAAKQQEALADVVTVLEQLFTAWRNLSGLTTRDPSVRINADLGMESRAHASTPLVSALLDKAIVRARHEPDLVAVRRLEALLCWQVELGSQSAAHDLGVLVFLDPMLKELSESLQGTTRLQKSFRMPGGTMLSTPEVLWRAIVHGDLASVESIIRHGGLVSGRTQDPSGHSVLWNAIAFERPDVALLLLRCFPPDMLHGVALGELHQRNGNSLLHLVSGFQHFDAQCEGLFAMIFERMPEALRIHRNLRGQSFLHIAAGRRNLWILSYAAARGLASQFSVADTGGLSPQRLLAQHLQLMQLHRPQLHKGDRRMPSWCSFGALQPGREKPPLADVAVELQGTALYGHRVILAAGSPKWHQQLRQDATPGKLQVLSITSTSKMEVVLFALRYLYTAETSGCSFFGDHHMLRELLLFCQSEDLPFSLRAWAADALLQADASYVASLLLEAPSLGMPQAALRFLAYRFLCEDAAWQAAAEAEVNGQNGKAKVPARGAALAAALSALESCEFGV